jgi:hypothetical protein
MTSCLSCSATDAGCDKQILAGRHCCEDCDRQGEDTPILSDATAGTPQSGHLYPRHLRLRNGERAGWSFAIRTGRIGYRAVLRAPSAHPSPRGPGLAVTRSVSCCGFRPPQTHRPGCRHHVSSVQPWTDGVRRTWPHTTSASVQSTKPGLNRRSGCLRTKAASCSRPPRDSPASQLRGAVTDSSDADRVRAVWAGCHASTQESSLVARPPAHRWGSRCPSCRGDSPGLASCHRFSR